MERLRRHIEVVVLLDRYLFILQTFRDSRPRKVSPGEFDSLAPDC